VNGLRKGRELKIAVISDDGVHISQHFGRAPYYVVVTVENGRIAARETRAKAGHRTFVGQHYDEPTAGGRHGYGPGSDSKHQAMAETIADCQALIAGGMGWGAFESMQAHGIEPVVCDVPDIDEAALRYAQGDLPNLMERVH
jgi:predicted Fe-Mo cluster-binding NifX family protein